METYYRANDKVLMAEITLKEYELLKAKVEIVTDDLQKTRLQLINTEGRIGRRAIQVADLKHRLEINREEVKHLRKENNRLLDEKHNK